MSEDKTIVTYPLSDAETVLKAMRAETSGKNPTLDDAARNRATHMAGDSLGSNAPFKAVLLERARLILKATDEEKSASLSIVPSSLWTVLLALVAFGLGFAGESLTSEASSINLLSSAFFGLIAWHLAVYAVLLIKTALRRPSTGLRSLFLYAASKPLFRGIGDKTDLLAHNTRILEAYGARAFHIAAVTFVAGAIAGVFFRGIGTQFTVGWESTWFSSSPDAVRTFLAYIFAPTNWAVGPFPDVSNILDLRFDRQLLRGLAPEAGPWLIRMGLLLSFVVIIPRLLLALVSHIRLKAALTQFQIDVSSPYFESIRSTWQAQAVRLDIIVDMNAPEDMLTDICALAQSVGFHLNDVKTHAWNVQDGLIVLSGLEKTEGPHEVWVLTSGALTPETEVLGAALSEIKTQIAPEHLILFADLRELVSRFAHLPERIESRKELYERFALESGVRVFFHTGAPFEETLLTALRETLAQGPQ